MTLLAKMDALQVHAAAAAITAGGATFKDVAVGFSAAKGRCVRIFYGGEREAPHFNPGRVLNGRLVGQLIITRGYWPISETSAKQQRVQEGEIASFVDSYRTRVLADSQLGGEATDLDMGLAQCEQIVLSGTKYAIADIEIVTDYDEYPLAP